MCNAVLPYSEGTNGVFPGRVGQVKAQNLKIPTAPSPPFVLGILLRESILAC